MDELKELFGDGQLSYADFEAKCNEKGYKLANLASGEYVASGKYEKLKGEYDKYKTENDVSKYADYDTIKAELEQLRTEKADLELTGIMANANVDERYRKFILSEVKPLVTDKKDFRACLTDYLKDNPQYIVEPETQSPQYVRFGSSADLNGQNKNQSTVNQQINNYMRGK